MKHNKLKKLIYIGSALLTLSFVAFTVLYKLDTLSIRLWDESRNACNAIEMYYNHNYSVRYFMGNPDNWELKPPLLTWLQVGSFHLFGINELSVRLPSALAVIALCSYFFYFFKKDNYLVAVVASLVLITCPGYMGEHIARFGDHDALLTLFSVLCALSLYKTIRSEGKWQHWALFWLFLLLAWFTKSIASLFFAPAWLVYLLYKKKLIWILQQKSFYIGLLTFLSLLGAFYWYHEIQTPGYALEVWNNEFFNRFFGTSNNYTYEKYSYFYYINGLTTRLGIWVWLAPILIVPFKSLKIKPLYHYSLILFFVTLFFISAGTKNFWYDAVLFPVYALLLGLQLQNCWQQIAKFTWAKIGYSIVLSSLFIGSFQLVIPQILSPKDHGYDAALYNLAYLLRDKEWVAREKEINLVHDNFESPIYFYYYKLKKEGFQVTFTNHPQDKELTAKTYISADPVLVELLEARGYQKTEIEYGCWKMEVE